MKKIYIIAASIISFTSMFGAENSITLYEAEKMVKGGRAILVKLPSEMTLETIKNSDKNISISDSNKTSDLNISIPNTAVITHAENYKVIPTASGVVALENGVSIAMPTTLSYLLEKLSKATHEVYFCEDEINIPPANIKINSLDHLNKYLTQVSAYRIEIIKESSDPTIPKVLKVLKERK